jgi:hypothetical protein
VKKKYRIDKKQIVVEIANELFYFNQAEIENISRMCQFLFDNLLIQAVPIVERANLYDAWNYSNDK